MRWFQPSRAPTDRTAKGHAALAGRPQRDHRIGGRRQAIGKGYPITPVLEPLAPFKDRMVVLSGLANNEARKLEFEIAGDHPRLRRLSHGSPPGDIGRGSSIAASRWTDCGEGLGKHTQLPSLEIGLEMPMVGACESAYSCVLQSRGVDRRRRCRWKTGPAPCSNG